MDNRRKPKFRNGEKLSEQLLNTNYGTEEYGKKKVGIEGDSKQERELHSNSEFQQQVISLVNQIVEKQNDLDKAINELNMKLKALS